LASAILSPLEVADQGRPELSVVRQTRIVGRQAHQRREPVALLRGDAEADVLVHHPRVPAQLSTRS